LTVSQRSRPSPARRLLLAFSLTAIAVCLFVPSAIAAEQPHIDDTVTQAFFVTTSCASFSTGINPREAETTYQFQYLTEQQFNEDHETFGLGTESVPSSPASIGSDNESHIVSAEVCGLSHGTTYRWRVLATNSQSPPGGTVLLPNEETFTTLFDTNHVFAGSFGAASSTPANPYPLSDPSDIAIDQSTSDVYVSDLANHRIEKFTASGDFLLMFGKGVNATGANVCTAVLGEECRPGEAGSTPAAFDGTGNGTGSPERGHLYIAVDNSSGPSAGDVYIGDTGDNLVLKFDSSGHLITSWGDASLTGPAPQGQLDGSSAKASAKIEGPFSQHPPVSGEGIMGIAVDNSGNLWVHARSFKNFFSNIFEFAPDGSFLSASATSQINGESLAIDLAGDLYLQGAGGAAISKTTPSADRIGFVELRSQLEGFGSTNFGIAIDPLTSDIFVSLQLHQGLGIGHYVGPECNPFQGVAHGHGHIFTCTMHDFFGGENLTAPQGLAIGAAATVYVVDSGDLGSGGTHPAQVVVFEGTGPHVSTGSTSSLNDTSATVTGLVDPADRGDVTTCRFEYGLNSSYGSSVPCEPATPYASAGNEVEVHALLPGLSPGTTYHYRVAAANSHDQSVGTDHELATTASPSIDAFSSSGVTATTADLNARINPEGLQTTCLFEYGTTPNYGQLTACPNEGSIGSSHAYQLVSTNLSELQERVVYHFRVVAENSSGKTVTEDQTFSFFAPSCPNQAERQQTKASYLPDCRAYELVSPGNANGTLLTNPPVAVSPYANDAFDFGGTAGIIPGAGDPENNIREDTYAAIRTPTGWNSHFVGIPGNQASEGETRLTNRSMDRFLTFENTYLDFQQQRAPAVDASAPYLYAASGELLGQWPTGLAAIPNGRRSFGSFQPSADFSHLAFSSNNVAFSPNGLITAPGSAYDFDTKSKTISLISKTASGQDIPQQPSNPEPGEAIQFPERFPAKYGTGTNWYPAVSTDGSHILMSTREGSGSGVRLYMRVNDAITYEISPGRNVGYVGMTEDGAKVFFTSKEQLTGADHDTSADLYLWSEAGEAEGTPLTLISKGDNPGAAGEPGQSDSCHASWVSGCGALPVVGALQSDNAIAARSGAIYFYSPEQLDGTKGAPNQENLYLYTGAAVRYVATLAPGSSCIQVNGGNDCSNGPLLRIQVSPEGDHAAFVTSQNLTAYSSNGHQEMFSYDPSATKGPVCVSCNPQGAPASSDVSASEAGLFMTDDGRTVFYTTESLVPQDTNGFPDVYEYVEGRPQLITTGTGGPETVTVSDSFGSSTRSAGLAAVSADGTNIFFSTYNTLVPQDRNGNFLKFYDARTGGGFFLPPAAAPCQAADECHGAGSNAPGAPEIHSGVQLGPGGNLQSPVHRKKSKRKDRHRKVHRKRTATNQHGGAK
jgi:hypothetical protein